MSRTDRRAGRSGRARAHGSACLWRGEGGREGSSCGAAGAKEGSINKMGKEGSMRVRVHCRVRPDESVTDSSFVKSSAINHTDKTSGATKGQHVVTLRGEESTWTFDSFLNESSSQESVYHSVAEPIVASVLKGYNGTIMAYGQTGSGKTHTMFGTGRDPGVIPRSLGHIFSEADRVNETSKGSTPKSQTDAMVNVSVSYVQIYNELLTDLLCPPDDLLFRGSGAPRKLPQGSSGLSIREDPHKGIIIDGLKSVAVTCVEEAMAVITEGDENRIRAATNMNASSSRSHACVIVNVNTKSSSKKRVKRGKLILVDLAGSERVSKSLGDHVYSGVRFSETRAINVSLSALGNCVSALANRSKHIPFRDAKLTRLLKDSLGGNSMTSLVINIAKDPQSVSETKSTLAFGSRAMAVTNTRVRVNEDVDFEQLYGTLQKNLDSKDDQIAELEISLRKAQIELAEAKRAQQQSESERDLVDMQLRTVSISGDTAEQIKQLQEEHRKALASTEARFGELLSKEQDKAARAQEEWYRIEYDLKSEREEHLRTCALLREKQHQLSDLELSHEERVAELLEEIRAGKEKADSLAGNLKNAFDERRMLLLKCEKYEKRLKGSKEFEDKGLQLMNKLTSRVEDLEAKQHQIVQYQPPPARKVGSGKRVHPYVGSNNNVYDSADDDDEYDRSSGRSSGRSTGRSSGRSLGRSSSRTGRLAQRTTKRDFGARTRATSKVLNRRADRVIESFRNPRLPEPGRSQATKSSKYSSSSSLATSKYSAKPYRFATKKEITSKSSATASILRF